MPSNYQLNLPPVEVTARNRDLRPSQAKGTLTGLNPLGWVRGALVKANLSQRYAACAMGISEPLLSAQLSDHNPDKHLSLRRLGRVDDAGFWREFALLILEDLGLHVVVLTPDQRLAFIEMETAHANYTRVMQR